jgi:hypothetical protein
MLARNQGRAANFQVIEITTESVLACRSELSPSHDAYDNKRVGPEMNSVHSSAAALDDSLDIASSVANEWVSAGEYQPGVGLDSKGAFIEPPRSDLAKPKANEVQKKSAALPQRRSAAFSAAKSRFLAPLRFARNDRAP